MLMARNLGPDPNYPDARRQPDYGVAASLEGDTLTVLLTFRRDEAYCCIEWGCHLALHEGQRWDPLRQSFAACCMPAPEQLRLKYTCVIEEGSIFFDFGRPDVTRRGWFAFKEATGSRYEASAVEAVVPG
jgi:hypothetical protein